MKFVTFFLGVVLMTASSYAAENRKSSADPSRPGPGDVVGEKNLCTTDTPPSSECAETVTAVFDNKGILWITWSNNDHIYVQSSADKGISFTSSVKVNAVPEPVKAHGEYRPKIKLDSKGSIYLTWTLKLEKRNTGHIRFSRSTDGGRHFSDPITINDNLDIISHRFDSLAVGKNGEIFIAWLDARDTEEARKAGQPFDGSSLYYVWSNDGGRHFYANHRIATHTCECCRLDTAIDKNNRPIVVWRHIFNGGIRDHAVNTFTDWNTPGDVQRLGYDNWKIEACPHHGPALSIADSGSYHAVWFSNSSTRQGLMYAYSTDSGQSFSNPVNFGKIGASHPHVLASGRQVRVVWQEFDGSKNIVQLMKSADEGKTWSKPEVLAQTAGQADQPFLVRDGQQFYLSWKIQQQSPHLIPIKG
jgi:hypothetical protein